MSAPRPSSIAFGSEPGLVGGILAAVLSSPPLLEVVAQQLLDYVRPGCGCHRPRPPLAPVPFNWIGAHKAASACLRLKPNAANRVCHLLDERAAGSWRAGQTSIGVAVCAYAT